MNDDNIVKRLDIHRTEITNIEGDLKDCQITVGQHDERLRAYEANSIRQNGTLEKLDCKIDDVSDTVHEIIKKVDAMSLSIANRMNQIERNGIKRDTDDQITVMEREAARDKKYLKDRITFDWKLIGALSSLALLFILVFISYSFHVFGGLP